MSSFKNVMCNKAKTSEKIKTNSLSFPRSCDLNDEAKNLITKLLVSDACKQKKIAGSRKIALYIEVKADTYRPNPKLISNSHRVLHEWLPRGTR